GGDGLVAEAEEGQTGPAALGEGVKCVGEERFDLGAQEVRLVGVHAGSMHGKEVWQAGGDIVGISGDVQSERSISFGPTELAAQLMAVFLGQTFHIRIPSAGEGDVRAGLDWLDKSRDWRVQGQA